MLLYRTFLQYIHAFFAKMLDDGHMRCGSKTPITDVVIAVSLYGRCFLRDDGQSPT